MAVTKEQVREELNASTVAVSDTKINAELVVAEKQVNKYLGGPDDGAVPDPLPVPTEIYDKAVLLVTTEAINQSLAPNGVLNQVYDVGMGEVTSTPVRIGRDPLKPAYPVLGPWTSGRFFCA
ncbi:hypothetical protein RB608_11965 [Nocardioides sp. LHD-245]|uniref:hypothetical protein n=1 Tax=Nocardioides sp. LHD-245 TaxID=3051387 RepID=UPI0027DF99A4|nr:hypothetical protein [Nocardioides sp. LHD-245]